MDKLRIAAAGVLFGLVACATPSPRDEAPAPEPVEAEGVPTGRLPTDARPTRYAITLRIDPSQEGFEGEETLDLTLTRPRSVVWMHSDGLTVPSPTVLTPDGRTLEATFEQVDDWGVARLTFPEQLPPGAYQVKLSFSGPFRRDLLGLYRGIEGSDAYVYSQFEPISARTAYPCFDEPSFKAAFELSILAPEGLVAIANTPERSTEEVDEGWILHRFEPSPVMSSYLLALAVGPFDVVEAAPIPPGPYRDRPLPLRGLAARGKGPELRWALDQVPGILGELEAFFAAPYPFRKLDFIAVTDFQAGAMENPGAITFRESILLVDGDAPEERRLHYVTVAAHELAHMWFGDLVTMPWWDDVWLNESFADWMEVKAVDLWEPGYQALTDKLPEVFEAMYTDSLAGTRHIRQEIESNHDIISAFDPISYEKGGAVLRMFEGYLGEEVFREGIRHHMAAHAYGSADLDDLLESLSEAAGSDVGTPFRGFLTQPGVPTLDMRLSCADEGATLTVDQRRYLPLGSGLRGSEQWQVPVCVRFSVGGEIDRQCALVTQPSQVVELGAKGCPEWIFPNAGAAGYYRWALDEGGMAALLGPGWGHLPVNERLSLGDAVLAAHHAGALGVAATWDVMSRLAADDDRTVALLPKDWLEQLHNRWLDAGERPALEARVQALYRPALARARALPPSPERDAFVKELVELLAFIGHDPTIRAELVTQGEALLGLKASSAPPVQEGLRRAALMVTVDERGAPAWDACRARLDVTDDGVEREAYLWAMGYSSDPVLRERNLQLRYGGPLRLNERGALARSSGRNPENALPNWEWHVAHLAELVQTLPPAFVPYLAYNAYGFCSGADADRAEAVLAPVVSDAPGGPRLMESILEGVRMCGAARDHHRAELLAWLAPPASASP